LKHRTIASGERGREKVKNHCVGSLILVSAHLILHDFKYIFNKFAALV